MKASIALILNYRKDGHGRQAIYLKITIDRKSAYVSTGEDVFERQWDKKNQLVKNHPLEVDINARITELLSTAQRKFTELSLAGKPVSAAGLKALISAKGNLNNLFEFTDQFISEVKHKRNEATLENYRKHLLKIEQFTGSRQLNFEDINPQWLAKFETFMRESGREKGQEEKGKGLGNNYVHALFKTLKVVFNAAKKRGVTALYPFDQYENPVYRAPVKDYLTLDEVAKIEEIADQETNSVARQSAIYLLLGISTGLRISDWFQFDLDKHVQDGQVLLRAKKNGEWVSMPVNAILRRNIARMRSCPLTTDEPVINRTLKDISKKAGISKHITSHTGRHTFAISLCAERGIGAETCAELMGITVATCVENYYRVTSRKINSETLKAWKGL